MNYCLQLFFKNGVRLNGKYIKGEILPEIQKSKFGEIK